MVIVIMVIVYGNSNNGNNNRGNSHNNDSNNSNTINNRRASIGEASGILVFFCLYQLIQDIKLVTVSI